MNDERNKSLIWKFQLIDLFPLLLQQRVAMYIYTSICTLTSKACSIGEFIQQNTYQQHKQVAGCSRICLLFAAYMSTTAIEAACVPASCQQPA
jgi:hypothetical protein